MRKTLPAAKAPLPKFESDEAAARYFESHSVASVWEQLPPGRTLKPSRALLLAIRERRAQAKSPISIRLEPEQLAVAKRIAATKSIGYQTQLRMWIAEGILKEQRRAETL